MDIKNRALQIKIRIDSIKLKKQLNELIAAIEEGEKERDEGTYFSRFCKWFQNDRI